MDLQQFTNDQKTQLDDFAFKYHERRKKGKEQTMFRPESQWLELLEEFVNERRGLNEDDQEAA